ncbi:NAD(+) synthase [Dermabacteraceae bacterium P13128]
MSGVYGHGFARVAAVTLPVALADPATNAQRHLEQARLLHEQAVSLAVFCELGISGYSLDDLFLQAPLLDAVEEALLTVADGSRGLSPLLLVGAPLRWRNRIYNCAVAIRDGQILAAVPKASLPNYREFYERRHFAPGDDIAGETLRIAGREVPFGVRQLFTATDLPGFTVHVEVCEDMWVPVPPSARAALAGATILTNLSGSPITVGKARDRKLLAASASSRCAAAYVFAAAGEGESSTDVTWDGQTFIYEAGDLLAETERFPQGARAAIADVDLDRLTGERYRQGSFDDNRRAHPDGDYLVHEFTFGAAAQPDSGALRREVDRFPFVPNDTEQLAQDCYEAYNIQVSALVQRLRSIGGDKPGGIRPVIGVSGGLDSTQALIVCARAMDLLGRSRSDILAITMPGFATSKETRSNAEELSTRLGCTFEELDIRPAATSMLKAMGHPAGDGEPVYDVTFENVQAGLRYDYLFRIANQRRGIVVGTGDLSELALGWCTYGVGDHMSHYTVNSGVPKTLMQHLIRWVVNSQQFDADTSRVLTAILETEISPELIPVADGAKPQSTEDSIGPYALHDFTLYHLLRRGYGPGKIAYLARHAWADVARGEWPTGYPEADRTAYTAGEIRHWLEVFIRRFFGNQFKRSAIPNGPKVVAGGSLSPRGDWRMPSDATARAWLDALERDVPRD